MRSIFQIIWSMLLCQALMAVETDNTKVETFSAQVMALEKLVSHSKAREEVFADLKIWDPEESSSLWQLPMRFRDRYLYDDSFRGTIRANFLPGFLNRMYGYITGDAWSVPIDSLVRTGEIGLAALRTVHKIPYSMFYAENNEGLKVFMDHETATNFTAIFSHMSALGSLGFDAMMQTTDDPFNMMAWYLASMGLKASSFLCAAATGYLSTNDDYIDVALRSLKRSYEKLHQEENLAVVLDLMAKRAQLKINTKKED